MIARTMLSILAVVGLAVLAYPLRDANAQSPTGEKPAVASSEKPKAEAPRRRSQKAKMAPPRRQPSALRQTLLKPAAAVCLQLRPAGHDALNWTYIFVTSGLLFALEAMPELPAVMGAVPREWQLALSFRGVRIRH